jgi:hypothetical protein
MGISKQSCWKGVNLSSKGDYLWSIPSQRRSYGIWNSDAAWDIDLLRKRAERGVATMVLTYGLLVNPVSAEDELAKMANGEFKPDLVSSECFATSCRKPTKACIEDADCKKGLMCTARCLGDSACITGCFARFGDETLNDLLQCSIEDFKCINIAIVPPGDVDPAEVPMPPKDLVSGFSSKSMDGEWYKVLGWNRQYDCFDCQKNSFKLGVDSTADMKVDFSMVAKRQGRQEVTNSLHMREKLTFDDPTFMTPIGDVMPSHRTAHTQGRMFGLSFWENWWVNFFVFPIPSIN